MNLLGYRDTIIKTHKISKTRYNTNMHF